MILIIMTLKMVRMSSLKKSSLTVFHVLMILMMLKSLDQNGFLVRKVSFSKGS